MSENKDSKNKEHIAQDKTTNDLSEQEVASVSGGAVPNASFSREKKNFIAQDKTTNDLSEQEVASVSGGGVEPGATNIKGNVIFTGP
ncbi:MAG: hypothetical protein V7K32_23510 [Nostoc sp.]|uniref:hypothetical protein n=1 Tax=Nostoc sp. TaxID=1180 RepID=UPI002FFC042A